MSQPQFNPNEVSGLYGELVNGVPHEYIEQNWNLFDKFTREFVRRRADAPAGMTFAAPTPVPAPPPRVITCEQCGKTYAIGPTPQSHAAALGHMKHHLKTKHQIELPGLTP